MTKQELESENERLLNALAEAQEQLQKLEEVVRDALDSDDEEEREES